MKITDKRAKGIREFELGDIIAPDGGLRLIAFVNGRCRTLNLETGTTNISDTSLAGLTEFYRELPRSSLEIITDKVELIIKD